MLGKDQMFAENFNGILFGWFGGYEIAIIAGVFVLLFGSAKLPQLFNNMGRSVNEFKAGMAKKPDSLEDESKQEAVSNEEAEEKETADA